MRLVTPQLSDLEKSALSLQANTITPFFKGVLQIEENAYFCDKLRRAIYLLLQNVKDIFTIK